MRLKSRCWSQATVIWSLERSWVEDELPRQLTCMHGRLVLVLSRDFSIGLLEYPQDMTADFFQKEWCERMSKEEATVPFIDIVYTFCCHILFLGSKSLNIACTLEEVVRLYSLNGKVWKNLWIYFKTTMMAKCLCCNSEWKSQIHNYLCNMIKIGLEKCHKKLKRWLLRDQ